jgi:SAM-dependent methyltransferase
MRLWDIWVEAALDKRPEPLTRMRWTQYSDHGPGHELLGDAERVLELGFGTGRHLMFLAGRGLDVTGVDLSPAGGKLVRERYPSAAGRFVCADARDFLATTGETFDAIYSVFGAMWFTDPQELLHLVRARLRPGGKLLFSQPPAIPGCYGAQGMFKGGFAGEPLFLRRYDYTPATWADMLSDSGFGHVDAAVLPAPAEGDIGTLLVQARRA